SHSKVKVFFSSFVPSRARSARPGVEDLFRALAASSAPKPTASKPTHGWGEDWVVEPTATRKEAAAPEAAVAKDSPGPHAGAAEIAPTVAAHAAAAAHAAVAGVVAVRQVAAL